MWHSDVSLNSNKQHWTIELCGKDKYDTSGFATYTTLDSSINTLAGLDVFVILKNLINVVNI